MFGPSLGALPEYHKIPPAPQAMAKATVAKVAVSPQAGRDR